MATLVACTAVAVAHGSDSFAGLLIPEIPRSTSSDLRQVETLLAPFGGANLRYCTRVVD